MRYPTDFDQLTAEFRRNFNHLKQFFKICFKTESNHMPSMGIKNNFYYLCTKAYAVQLKNRSRDAGRESEDIRSNDRENDFEILSFYQKLRDNAKGSERYSVGRFLICGDCDHFKSDSYCAVKNCKFDFFDYACDLFYMKYGQYSQDQDTGLYVVIHPF